MWPRWQLPVFAPVAKAAIGRAVRTAFRNTVDPRPALAQALGERFKADVVHLTSSGTEALQVAVRLARVSAGAGAVALPAYGCFDIASAAVGADAEIALYDLDPATLTPDLDSLTGVLAAGARIVVVAPISGVPVPWDEIARCAASFGACVVEDAAQGHGARWRNRPLGTLGAVSVLSFGRGKGWTGGRGGAVLVRDPVLAAYSREMPLPEPPLRGEADALVVAAAMAFLASPNRYGLPARLPWLGIGETKYRAPSPPGQISRSAAQLVLASQAAAETEAASRRANAREWIDELATLCGAVRLIEIGEGAQPGYLRLPVRLSHEKSVVRARNGARHGVAPGYPSTLADLPAVQSRLRTFGPLPGARALVRELVTLPTHSLTTRADRRAILAMIAGAHPTHL